MKALKIAQFVLARSATLVLGVVHLPSSVLLVIKSFKTSFNLL
jgi:hypothetical protein